MESWWERHRRWLGPLAAGYRILIGARNWAYDRGLFPARRVRARVISVGNLALGGSGKTPLVLALLPHVQERVAVVARGYRGQAERRSKPLLICSGEGPLYPPEVCGDEPFLIASRFPNIISVVGRDRVAAARLAIAHGAKTILLDDGMQHRRLHRDLELVLVDSTLLGESLFPRGRLREPLSSLRRATHLICTDEGADFSSYGDAPLFHAHLEGSVEARRVALVCGIARPERFRQTVEASGATVVDTLFLGDHQPIGPKVLPFAKRAKERGAELLLCTEKDWVKRPRLALPLPLDYLRVDLCLDQNLIDSIFQET